MIIHSYLVVFSANWFPAADVLQSKNIFMGRRKSYRVNARWMLCEGRYATVANLFGQIFGHIKIKQMCVHIILQTKLKWRTALYRLPQRVVVTCKATLVWYTSCESPTKKKYDPALMGVSSSVIIGKPWRPAVIGSKKALQWLPKTASSRTWARISHTGAESDI